MTFEERVDEDTDKILARKEAARRIALNDVAAVPPPRFRTLREWLQDPPEPVKFRIQGFHPINGRIVAAAQYKAGKTTMVTNLVRSLSDGDPFLGLYPTVPVVGAIAVLDFEMSAGQVVDWYRDQNITDVDRVILVPLRGAAGSFNIIDPDIRARWSVRLETAGVKYLVVDCLRAVLDGIGLDENEDAGMFLAALDALLKDAAIPEATVVHHMGHTNERSRGDSRIRDWPDAEWRVVRQNDEPSSPRFISAFGRDVEVKEAQLEFDPQTRRLSIAGGSRLDAGAVEALEAIRALLGTSEPLSGRAIKKALVDDHKGHEIDRSLKLGVARQMLTRTPGKRGALLYSVSSVRVSASVQTVFTGTECSSVPVLIEHGHSHTPIFDPKRAFGS